jgi:hypothetical protein
MGGFTTENQAWWDFIEKPLEKPFSKSFGVSWASVLITEYIGNQDLDRNRFIYGKDFMIENNENKPKMLETIEQSPDWIDPMIKIDWKYFLDPDFEMYSAVLITEYIEDLDLDNNEKIYGKDFMIEDNENKPKIFEVIEDLPNWVDPIITQDNPIVKVDWLELLAWALDNSEENPLEEG